MSSAQPQDLPSRWNFAAAFAAWLVPGLGHLLLGQKQRGLILLTVLLALWLGGLLIGGISVIDRRNHPAWFLAQMLIAPSFVIDNVHDRMRGMDGVPPPPTAEPPAYEPSFGRVAEQGTLYTALAGLLNLLAIVDVLYRDPRDPRVRATQQTVSLEP